MPSYNATTIKALDANYPAEGSSTLPEYNDAIREVKTVLKNLLTIVSKTASYSVTTTDSIVKVDASAGDVTLTLPSIATYFGTTHTKHFSAVKTDTGTYTVIVSSADGIDGDSTYVLNEANETVTLMSDGATWRSITKTYRVDLATESQQAQKIMLTSTDPVPNYLASKLVAGSIISLTTSGTGTTEQTVTIAVQPQRTPEVVALSYSTTSTGHVAVDFASGTYFTLSLTQNTTIDFPSNVSRGDGVVLEITQTSGTGAYTVTFASGYNKASADEAYVMTTTASKTDMIALKARATNSVYIVGVKQEFS